MTSNDSLSAPIAISKTNTNDFTDFQTRRVIIPSETKNTLHTTQQPMMFAANDNQIQTEELEVVQPLIDMVRYDRSRGRDGVEQEKGQAKDAKAYPSSLRSNSPSKFIRHTSTLQSLNTLYHTCDLFIMILISIFRIATEQIFVVIVSPIAVIASMANVRRSALAYYVMFCLLTMWTVSTDFDSQLQCGNDGYLYRLYYLDIYTGDFEYGETDFEFDLQIASTNTNNESYYEISIYIKSTDGECASPTYTVSYYQDNITILTNSIQSHKECIHSHQTTPCTQVMETCIVSNASTIEWDDFDNISVLLPPSQYTCSASDINLKLSIQCLIYEDSFDSPLFITNCIVYGLYILFVLILWRCISYPTNLAWPVYFFISAYSRVVMIHVFYCIYMNTDALVFVIFSSAFIALILIPFFRVVFVYCTSDMKGILNEHMRRREQFEPDVTINKYAAVLFMIGLIFSDLRCTLNMFKYTVFGIESEKILTKPGCFFKFFRFMVMIIDVALIGALLLLMIIVEQMTLMLPVVMCLYLHALGQGGRELESDDSDEETLNTKYLEAYSFMKMECKFAEVEREVEWNTTSRFADREAIFTKHIVEYLNTSKYYIEVVRIHQGNMILYIEYDDENGTNIGAELEMESYLHQHLAHQNFSNYLEEHTDYAPIISLQGQCETGQIHQLQVAQIVTKYKEQLTDVESLMSGMKPLHTMSAPDVIQLITYWILTDQKQCAYRTEIMTILKTKNIDGFIHHNIQLREQEKIEIAKYLENIIGDYINSVMMRKIGQKLEEVDHKNITTQEIGELICMFSVDVINEGLLDDMDGFWVATNDHNGFIHKLRAITG
eukprot:962074_1